MRQFCDVTLKIKVPGDKYKHLIRACAELEKAGVTFEVSTQSGEDLVVFNMELDSTLSENARVIFKNFK